MANQITATGDNESPISLLIRKLHLTHIVALIMAGIGFLGANGFAVYILKAGPQAITDLVLIDAISMTGFVAITYLYIMGILGRAYVNGTATLSGIAFQGGGTPPTTPLAQSGATVLYGNISNADLASLASLLQTSATQLSPEQIKAIGSLINAIISQQPKQ